MLIVDGKPISLVAIGSRVHIAEGQFADMIGTVRGHTHTGPAIDAEGHRNFPTDQANLHLVKFDNPTETSGPYQWFRPSEIALIG